MKKFISLLCTVVMVLQMVVVAPTHVHAADSGASAAVSVSTVTANPGDTGVEVAVDLTDNPGICGMLVTLTFEEGLTLTKIEQGSALASLTLAEVNYDHVNQNKKVKLSWDGLVADFTTGTILKMYFDVAADAAPGTYELNMTYRYGDVYDNDFNDHTLNITNGAIVVEDIPGPGPDPTDPLVISIGDTTGRLGNTVTVPVMIDNNPGVVSVSLEITYDTNVFTLVEVNDAGLIPGAMHTNVYTSPYTLTWANDTSLTNFTDNGKLVDLVFEINEDAAAGDYEFTVSVPVDGIYNFDAENVDYVTENGTCTIIDFIPGDLNRDGSVTNKDRLILSRHLAKWDGYGVETFDANAADMNGDGAITNKDRLILSRHLAKWNGYEDLSGN